MPINPALIGKKVGSGLQHHVFAYGTDQVIKIPRWWMRWSFRYEDKVREFELLKTHAEDFIPETHVAPYENSYCYIQKRITEATILSLEHAQVSISTFGELQKRNKQLIRSTKRSMDFIGFQTYTTLPRPQAHKRHRHINNVVVHPDAPHGIYLLDTDTLYTNPFNIRKATHIVFSTLSFIVYIYTIFLLKAYRVHLDG